MEDIEFTDEDESESEGINWSFWKSELKKTVFVVNVALIFLVLGTVLGSIVTVDTMAKSYKDMRAENYSVHYNPEVFNEMRGEYTRESWGEFSEDMYCMYGEANSTGVYIQDLEKASYHYAANHNVTTSNGEEVTVEGVSGYCPRPTYPFTLGEYDWVRESPLNFLATAKKMFDIAYKDYQPGVRFLGSCHSHPPDNSKQLSRADYKAWGRAPLDCIMYREKPYIYTKKSLYHDVNN